MAVYLNYVPPFDWEFFLRYLSARATAGVEVIDSDRYVRSFEFEGHVGTFSLVHQPHKYRLVLDAGGRLDATACEMQARIRRLFDLDADMERVQSALGDDPHLATSFVARPGIRIPGAWCPFELLVRTIVGQQVTVKAATTIMARIVHRLGSPLEKAERHGPQFLFPSPRTLAEGNLEGIGMPMKRAIALQRVSRAIADNSIALFSNNGAGEQGVRNALLELPGIGPWTVDYFALRGLRNPDAWPGSDLVLRRFVQMNRCEDRLGNECISDRWRPFRGYAAMHVWNVAALDVEDAVLVK